MGLIVRILIGAKFLIKRHAEFMIMTWERSKKFKTM